MSPTKYKIGTKIFGAFVAMSLLIAGLGVAGYYVLSAAGGMAVTIFDGPLQAINYAGRAQHDFTEMQLAEFKLEHAATASDRDATTADIAQLADTFKGDLDVAAQRSLEADEQKMIAEIGPLVDRWRAMRAKGDREQLEKLDQQIDDRFDLLIEYNTDHSYINRRKTAADIASYRNVSILATVLALLLAGGITLFLRRRIINPLTAAANVADRIAKGELQIEIPPGGADETGALLKSMTVMQDNIRAMMARETSRRLSAENRLSDALETSREGVILVAPDGRIALANSMCHEFFPEFGKSLAPGQMFNIALDRIQTRLAKNGVAGKIDAGGHTELQLDSGRWLRLTASATSEGGSIIFLSDFTLIKEREETLRRAVAAAEAANAAKTRFLANMSHELRTPLNAIIGFSEIINGQLFGELGNARYLDYSGDILRSGRHLLEVINSVLDLSKSEAGKMMLDAKDVDMRDVLNDCIVMVREQLMDAKLHFVVSGLDRALPMNGDAAKLRQVFLNLLSNAVKFTAAGGQVSLTAATGPEGVTVTVGDSGIGMSPEDLAVALEPFGQVDNRLERRYEGTGLGLPLTRALVELHGGQMHFDSARGQGTRVTVGFPLAQTIAFAEAV